MSPFEFLMGVLQDISGYAVVTTSLTAWSAWRGRDKMASSLNKILQNFSKTNYINFFDAAEIIQGALEDAPEMRCILIEGVGGIGKTRLLQQVEETVAALPQSKNIRWGGFFDLYHSDLHDTFRIQTQIAKFLDPSRHFFNTFQYAVDEYEQAMEQGVGRRTLEQINRRVSKQFAHAYLEFSKYYRPVIAFDTAETLQYESNLIEEACQFERTRSPLLDWLQPILTLSIEENEELFQNTVLLIASRPNAQLRQVLQNRFKGNFDSQELPSLTIAQAEQFVEQLISQLDLSDWSKGEIQNFRDRLSIRSQFDNEDNNQNHNRQHWLRPVVLTMWVELELLGLNIAVQDDIQKIPLPQLVKNYFSYDTEDRRILFYAALARKGLDSHLVDDLDLEWDYEKSEWLLDQLSDKILVKLHTRERLFFLHDVLYELFDSVIPHNDPQALTTYATLVEYYRIAGSKADSLEREMEARVNQFYYQLCYQPQAAFTLYRHWMNDAVDALDHNLYTQLRDALLRFWKSPRNRARAANSELSRETVERENIILQIKEYAMRGESEKAIIACQVALCYAPPLYQSFRLPTLGTPSAHPKQIRDIFTKTDPLFWAQLFIHYGQALSYHGDAELSQKVLEKAIYILDGIIEKEPKRFYLYLSGTAFNHLGYLCRTIGQYKDAQQFYQKALTALIRARATIAEATTRNNLAYLLSIRGKREALEQIEEGLELRLALKKQYAIATGYNTRGIIFALDKQYDIALRDCERAYRMFTQLDNRRGIGMINRTLGYIFRQRGVEYQNNPDKQIVFFIQSEKHLLETLSVFIETKEFLRLWDAYNELGSLHNNWGKTLTLQNDCSADAYYEKALEYHFEALAIAFQHLTPLQLVDTHDDIAYVCLNQNEFDAAQQWREMAINQLPIEYQIHQSPSKTGKYGSNFWQMAGKLYAQHALSCFLLSEQDEANLIEEGLQYLAYAVYALSKFSSNKIRFINGIYEALSHYHSLRKQNPHYEAVFSKRLHDLGGEESSFDHYIQ